MAQQITYNVEIVPEDGNWTVIVPDIPGCLTYGHSIEEAKAMAKDAIEGMLYSFAKHRQPIPEARAEAGKETFPITVELPDFGGHSRSA